MIGTPRRTSRQKDLPRETTKSSKSDDVRRVTRCRVCGSRDLTMVLNLGKTPLANSYLTRPTDPEKWFPLQLLFCNECTLVQLGHVVNPNLMFRSYAYRSSASQTMPRHFQELAGYIHSNFLKSSKDLVVEIGSNDGTLLSAFKTLGVRVLGIDPAMNLAKIANDRGLETLPEFFDSGMASVIRETRGPAKALIGNNVFAHIDNLHDFMEGITLLLDDEGVFSIEVPYLGDLNQSVEYDTIYHEHLSYFSARPIAELFSRFGFSVISVSRIETHGGSIRVVGRKNEHKVAPFLGLEKRAGLDRVETFRNLARRIEYQRDILGQTLGELKSHGYRIIGYGAPAKSNTLLNYCKIGPDTIDYLTDTTSEKVGKFTPGTHIPIREETAFKKDQPEFALMLAWNYEREILAKEADYTGRFIMPLPYPRVL